jgi:TPR repeat protein
MPFSFRFPIALILSILYLATPTWADFDAGVDAYERGEYPSALREFTPLAKQGVAEAQHFLGVLYEKGQGVLQDFGRARQWYEKAAAQGNADAQYNLGLMYDYGYGVPQDYGQARQWYKEAAAQGLANAQFNLGVLYHRGYGGPQDFVQAHLWYHLAGANGETKAAILQNALVKQMTPADISEAQRLAREWKPKQ